MKSRVHLAVHHVVEKFTVLGVLHHHEDVLLGLDDFIELGDRRVSDQFENVQLSCDSLHIGDVFYFVFLENLNCHRFLGVLVDGLFDLPESAPPDSPST